MISRCTGPVHTSTRRRFQEGLVLELCPFSNFKRLTSAIAKSLTSLDWVTGSAKSVSSLALENLKRGAGIDRSYLVTEVAGDFPSDKAPFS